MKAMAASAFGGPEVLAWMEVPQPAVGPLDLLVEVDHAGINPVDTKIRSGIYGQGSFPLVQGYDVSGVVTQVGSDVKHFKVGDEVYGCGSLLRPGANAPFMAIDARLAALKPRTARSCRSCSSPTGHHYRVGSHP